MARDRRYGNVKNMVSDLVNDNGGPKEAAFKLQKSYSQMAAYMDESADTAHMSVANALILSGPHATSLAEFAAHRCGGSFLPGISSKLPAQELIAQSMIEQAEFFAQVVMHDLSKPLRKTDKARLLKEIDDAVRVLGQTRMKLSEAEEAGA